MYCRRPEGQKKRHVIYGAHVTIVRRGDGDVRWWIFRRYSEWLGLYHRLLLIKGPGPAAPKPPPKLFRTFEGKALTQRQAELNEWLARVLDNTRFAQSSGPPELGGSVAFPTTEKKSMSSCVSVVCLP